MHLLQRFHYLKRNLTDLDKLINERGRNCVYIRSSEPLVVVDFREKTSQHSTSGNRWKSLINFLILFRRVNRRNLSNENSQTLRRPSQSIVSFLAAVETHFKLTYVFERQSTHALLTYFEQN